MVRKSPEEYVKQVNKKHPEIKVIGEYQNANARIQVRCTRCGYEWSPIAQSLISGHGCPSCYGNTKKTTSSFKRELYSINKDIAVLGEYGGTHAKIQVKCKKCGNEWLATPRNLLAGSGCLTCSGKKQKTQDEFIYELKKINSDIEVEGSYISIDSAVLVRCLVCGHEWSARPHNLLKGSGCPSCANLKNGDRARKTQEEFEKELHNINPYIFVIGKYKSSGAPIRIRCSRCDYEWMAIPNNLLRGSDCPNCLKYLKTSFPEQVLFYYIREKYPEAVNGFKDIFPNKMELDIYIPMLKTGIEYDGAIWHSGKSAKAREEKKYDICRKHGIRLIRIKENYENEADADIVIYAQDSMENTLNQLKAYIELPTDIDITRDAALIKSQYLFGNKPGTTSYFTERLQKINPDIEVLGDYVNSTTKIKVKSRSCGHTWETRPGELLHGRGCPQCARERAQAKHRKTQEDFIAELHEINPNICVLGKYRTRKTKVKVKCAKCGTEWETAPANLLAGHGCMKCSPYKNTLKTNQQFVEELMEKNPNLEPLQEYIGTSITMKVRCRLCGEIIEKTPSYMLRGHSCHKCKGKR